MHFKTLFSNPCRRFALALAAAGSWWIPSAASAAVAPGSASLVWDANPESNVTGYNVHIGDSSGNYFTVINVVGDTRMELPTFAMGTTLYLAVSAINSEGLESSLSAELVVVVDVPAPVVSTSFSMNAPGQGQLQWKYPRNATVGADRFTVYASEDLVSWIPASEVLISDPASSDSDWLYFDFPYDTAAAPRMFFRVGAANAFGEIL